MKLNGLIAKTTRCVKAVSLALALAVLIPFVNCAAPALAAGAARIYCAAGGLSPAVGDTLTVTVSLAENPGFAALQFDLVYDTAVLSCTGCRLGELLKKAAITACNSEDDGAITVAAATTDEIRGDGPLAALTFKVIGKGEARLSVDVEAFCDIDYNELAYTALADSVAAVDATSGAGGSGGGGGANSGSSPGANPGPGSGGAATGSGGLNSPAYLFADTAGHWAAPYIEKAAGLGLMTGFEDGRFRPDDNMTRAQFAVVLWRMAGKPESSGASGFRDIRAAWYEKAAAWASEKGYIKGTGGLSFSPDSPVTRQELAAMLFRYSGGVSGEAALLGAIYDGLYADSAELAEWGREPMYWAVYHKIINGVTETELSPKSPATRAQVAAIIARYLERFS